MLKKKGTKRQPPKGRARVTALRVAAASLALCVVAAGIAATRWEPVRRRLGLAPAAEPVVQQQSLQLSKEYVYAGGRLVATEEPTPQGPPPTNLVATARGPVSAISVDLTWTAPAGSISGYVVERAASKDGPYSQVGTMSASQLSFTDSTVLLNAAYLYRVKATYTTGGFSDYSNRDLATTVIFTDDPIHVGVTAVSAVHLTEMRRAVDAARALAGLGAASWQSNPAPQQGGHILASHFLELRTNLNPALTALGMTQLPGDPTLAVGLPVKAAHIQDVREKVR